MQKKKKKSSYRPYTLHKIYPRMAHRTKCEMQNIKILEGNIEENLGYDDDILDTTPKIKSMKKIHKLDFIKI